MRRTSKAPSAAAHRAGSTHVAGHRARGLLDRAGLCLLVLAASLVLCAPVALAAPPTITVEPADGVDAFSAHVEGEIDPQNFPTGYHFEAVSEIRFQDNLASSLPGFNGALQFGHSQAPLAAGSGPHTVEATAPLEPNTTYRLRLIATSDGGQAIAVAPSFTTGAIAPTLAASVFHQPGPGAVDVGGFANPHNAAEVTECHFEYGPTPAYGQSTLCSVAPEEIGENESQTITVRATAGQFKLSFGGDTTSDLAFNAPRATVQAALEALPSISPGDVTVTFGPGDETGANPYWVDFTGSLAAEDVERIVGLPGTTPLSGGATSAAVSTSREGAPGVNEAQQVTVRASSGQFKLSFGADTTSDLAFDAPPAVVQTELEALPSIGAGNVSVAGGPGNVAAANPYAIVFIGALGGTNVDQLVSSPGTTPLGPPDSPEVRTTALGGPRNLHLPVRAELRGLAPGQTYHFRYSLTTDIGTTQSADRAFVVREGPAQATCPNAGRPGVSFLPHCRAWEMVSPPDKNGGDIAATGTRTHAAAAGGAVAFSSLVAFGDARGTGIATEYIAERSADPSPGDNGWATHAITPAQGFQTTVGPAFNAEPAYLGISDDLTTGVYRPWMPLTAEEPNVAGVLNLYRREGLRDPGPGSYELLTLCPSCVSPLLSAFKSTIHPGYAGASEDFGKVLFETGFNLAPGATGGTGNKKLYEWEHGTLRLAGVLPNGTAATRSVGGSSVLQGFLYRSHPTPIARDGSRVVFTVTSTATGSDGPVHMRVNGRTTVQLNASERTVPTASTPAQYWSASADMSRVFLTSTEALTDSAPTGSDNKLYMWERQPANETQRVAVDAASGTFTLSFQGRTTAPIPFDAPASGPGSVQSALEELTGPAPLNQPVIGAGNVTVSGGPGGPGAASPYLVTFGGDFAGANVAQLTASAAGLGGGTATVTTTSPVHNLTYLNVDQNPADERNAVAGVVGASDDGRYVYFAASGQLVPGAPRLGGSSPGLYLWHNGAISYIGKVQSSDAAENFNGTVVTLTLRQGRMTPDGRHLLYWADSGDGLLSAHGGVDRDHGIFGQLYVYEADTGELACASCDPSGAASTATANSMVNQMRSASLVKAYQNHALSEDGRYAFFSTADSLLPVDDNQRIDAYVYDVAAGTVHLLSTGKSPHHSWFLEASPSGEEAFFVTRDRLSAWDEDGAYDLYAARVGGGFPEPALAPAPCVGDACQGAIGGTPAAAEVGTAALSGRGNAAPRRSGPLRCGRNGRRVITRNGRARCVKKVKKTRKKGSRRQHRRAADTNRRAHR